MQTKARQHGDPQASVGRTVRRPNKSTRLLVDHVTRVRAIHLERPLLPKYQGSVGSIFVGTDAGGDRVCIKVTTDKSAAEGAATLRGVAGFAMLANQEAAKSVTEIARLLESETDMEREAAMSLVVDAALKDSPELEALPCAIKCTVCEFVPGEPRSDLVGAPGACVYEHVPGVPLELASDTLQHKAFMSLVGAFFVLLECRGVLLGDVNIGNLIVQPGVQGEKPTLWLIDHGAVAVLDLKQRTIVEQMAFARKSGAVRKWVMDNKGSPQVANAADEGARVMASNPIDFTLLRPASECLTGAMWTRLPPEAATILRSQVHLFEMLRRFHIRGDASALKACAPFQTHT